MKNIQPEDTFEYNPNNKTFYFFSEHNFQWAKAVLSNLSLKLYLDDELIKPFKLFYCVKNCSLTLKGLTDYEEQRLLDLFKQNGLKHINPINKIDIKVNQDSQHTKDYYFWERPASIWKTYAPEYLFTKCKSDRKPSCSLEEVGLLQEQKKQEMSELELSSNHRLPIKLARKMV